MMIVRPMYQYQERIQTPEGYWTGNRYQTGPDQIQIDVFLW